MRVGILGGTFDPPHLGHLELAKSALTSTSGVRVSSTGPKEYKAGGTPGLLHGVMPLEPLDLVLWVPNVQNPLKDEPGASALDRLEMIRLMIEDQPQMAVSDVELTREGPSYMVDTLEEIQITQPTWNLWLIMGADSLASFDDWHYPERILRMARLAVAVRPGTNLAALMGEQPEIIQDKADLAEMVPFPASSTEIRAQLAAGEPTPALHPAVAAYIAEYGLYK